ncbi:MAG: cytochrome c1 [Alphaproteobacteria bacterium]|nr:cytochrome c1 [Alphaproteobacteria bacterium]
MRKILLATLLAAGIAGPAAAAESPKAPAQEWSFGGLFGTLDLASAQRGFQVYKEVCATCHGLYHLSYRNLGDIGFNEEEVKAIAAQATVRDGPNDQGEMFDRPGRPSDRFVRPFANEKAARATNNGAYPPDLSLITKARADGPNYIYGLLTGYGDPPPGTVMGEGMNWNKYFPGHQIAMPPPLTANGVTYSDGTPSSVEQMAKDLVTFLAWSAEPEMEQRKRTGVKVILFLLVLTGLLYAVKRKVWAAVH